MTIVVDDTVTDGGGRTRLDGDRGAGLVAGIVLMFSFTFLGLVWLATDVDRGISNQSSAQSIAFQSARSAAQAAVVGDLRTGAVTIDEGRAHGAAQATAAELFSSYRVDGVITRCLIDPAGPSVTVEVAITDGGITARGVGVVTVERTP